MPIEATKPGSFVPGLRVRRYHSPTRAKRGPATTNQPLSNCLFFLDRGFLPDVIAIKIMKNDRSGYRSPIVADTDGNHSWGYP